MFYADDVASSTIISCSVRFKKGEWVGILGACGDATTMNNSYGPGAFQSDVLGTATTISRFGMQANMVGNKGNFYVWGVPAGSGGSIGRVEVYVRPDAQLIGGGTGKPGTSIDFTLIAPADAGLSYQLGTSLGAGPIPIDTRQLALSPDDLLVLSTTNKVPMIFQNYTGVLDKAVRRTRS